MRETKGTGVESKEEEYEIAFVSTRYCEISIINGLQTMAKQEGTSESVLVTEENDLCGDGVKEYLEPRFECPICLTWLRDPILTSCGHKFCSRCIYTWLQKEGACCPVDSRPLKSESDLFRDLYTSREISQQRTSCPYQQFGCNVELSPVDMETHVNECTYKRSISNSQGIDCLFKDVGCTEILHTEEASQAHLEESINLHLAMILKAIPRLSVTQPDGNSMSAEAKLWDPPPKNEGVSEKSEPSLEWQQLLKNLYERLVVLEQQNRELTITVSNQKNQITTLQTSLRFNQEEMFLRNCNGTYIWKLSSFHEKLTSMMNDPLKMFYSPGFYTGSNGYKICARINISSKDSEFLSLLLHIMKSENDDALDWPFSGLLLNYVESYLPVVITRSYRYGKFASKINEPLAERFEVPKRWFKHFYILAAPASIYTLYLVISVYFYNASISNATYWILDILLGSSRKALATSECTFIATLVMCLHCCKRLYETQCVSVFSNSKMNTCHYIAGYIHYIGVLVCLVGESKGFVRGSSASFSWSRITFVQCICAMTILCASYIQLRTNIILGNLRKDKKRSEVSTAYKIPHGELFRYISCPLQCTEILIYIFMSILLWQCSTFHYITAWVLSNQIEGALLSHWWYQQTFKNYPKERKALIPFLF
ncbi:hypothetical protein KM043_005343 [Ampulex compressa]|nr:hypothetical protein KM043_005343 [Ampulex compressa]